MHQLVICVTGLDLVNFQQEAYTKRKKVLEKCAKFVGFSPRQIHIIPLSTVFGGLNVSDESLPSPQRSELSWYKGPSLLSIISTFTANELDISSSGLAVFNKAMKISGVGTVIVAGVARGTFNVGSEVMLVPGGFRTTIVKSIECHHLPVSCAQAGMQVGFSVQNVSVRDFGRGYRGFIVSPHAGAPLPAPLITNQQETKSEFVPKYSRTSADWARLRASRVKNTFRGANSHLLARFPVPAWVTRFTADIVILSDKIGKRGLPFSEGVTLMMQHRLTSSQVRVEWLVAMLDSKLNLIQQLPSGVIKKRQYVRVELTSRTPVCVAPQSEAPFLSRLVFTCNGSIIAAGLVKDVFKPNRRLRLGMLGGNNSVAKPLVALLEFADMEVVLSELTDPVAVTALHTLDVVCVCGDVRSASTRDALQTFVSDGGALLVLPAYDDSRSDLFLQLFGLQAFRFNASKMRRKRTDPNVFLNFAARVLPESVHEVCDCRVCYIFIGV